MQQQIFSKRERAAIDIATLAFIGVSGIGHFILGGFIGTHLPHWAAAQADQTPTPFRVGTFEHPSPTPRPTPTPTPPPRVTNPTRSVQSPSPHREFATTAPFVRSTPQPRATGGFPPNPTTTASPEAIVTATPAAIASATPESGEPKPATPATFKHKVVPDYPRLCVDEGAGGRVTVDVTIDPDGSVAAAWVGQTSGFPCLDAAALAAAKESTYNPPEVGGRPVAETYLILYEFSIDS